jgi:TonB family protein
VLISEEGRPTEIEITKSLGFGLDVKAIEVLQKWRFKPLTDSTGKPLRVLTVIQMQFQLF